MFEQGVELTVAAGAGFKILQVLNGTTDLYFHSTYIKKWDLCAGGMGGKEEERGREGGKEEGRGREGKRTGA